MIAIGHVGLQDPQFGLAIEEVVAAQPATGCWFHGAASGWILTQENIQRPCCQQICCVVGGSFRDRQVSRWIDPCAERTRTRLTFQLLPSSPRLRRKAVLTRRWRCRALGQHVVMIAHTYLPGHDGSEARSTRGRGKRGRTAGPPRRERHLTRINAHEENQLGSPRACCTAPGLAK